jgi:hypothetical protein
LIWAKAPPDPTPTAVLVRPDGVIDCLCRIELTGAEAKGGRPEPGDGARSSRERAAANGRTQRGAGRRFYGSVEIDMVRLVKAFDAILNAVVMELQRTSGATAKVTLEIEAIAPDGFSDAYVGIVRDNARRLRNCHGILGRREVPIMSPSVSDAVAALLRISACCDRRPMELVKRC